MMLGMFQIFLFPTFAQQLELASSEKGAPPSHLGASSPNSSPGVVASEVSVTNEELAHRLRMLELKVAENDAKAAAKGDKWYSTILVPLATAIIGSIVVLLSALLGRNGQEAAARAAAEANATLARNAAADAKQMAADSALFKHAEQMMEFKLKQIQDFYGPLYAALQQSKGLYDKLLDQLINDEPGTYRKVENPTGDDYRFQVMDNQEQWQSFRLVDQLPAVKNNPRALALVDANLALGAQMCEIISKSAGYASEDLLEQLGQYMAHYAILKAIRDGSEKEAFPPGRHKIGAYPFGFDKNIGEKYHALSKEIGRYGQAYERTLQILAERAIS